MVRFVKASMKGWDYAREHPDEAAKIVLDNDETGAQTEQHQAQMMERDQQADRGLERRLDVADADRTVETLLSGGSDPVITKKPEGAWTDAVTKKADDGVVVEEVHVVVAGPGAPGRIASKAGTRAASTGQIVSSKKAWSTSKSVAFGSRSAGGEAPQM